MSKKEKSLTEVEIENEGKDIEWAEWTPYTDLETKLRSLVSKTIDDYKLYVFPEIYDIIKMKVLFSGDAKVAYKKAGQEYKSCEVYPLIDSVHDTYVANMYDTTVSTRAIARNPEDIELTSQAQNFYDWCYSITHAEDVKELIRNEASLIGTSYGMAWFKNIKKENEYTTDTVWTKKKFTVQEIQPTLEHVPFFELFYPLSTSDFYNSQFKFRRKIMSYETIQDRYSNVVDFEDKNKIALIKEATTPLSYVDFNKIWDIKSLERVYMSECEKNDAYLWNPLSFMYDNLFALVQWKNDLYEVIEYWEWDKLIIMINGRIIFDDKSPYPLWMPFGILAFETRAGTCRGRWLGHKLMPHQKQANTYYNRIQDGVNMHLDPMYIVQSGQIVGKDGQTPKRIKHIPWGVLETKDASVNNGGISPIDFVDYNIISLAMRDLEACRWQAQEIAGTNSYSQGGQGKVERSFWAVNAKLGVVRSRLQPIIKSMNRFDSMMFEHRLSVSKELMEEEVQIRVLGEDGIKWWETIKPWDILNRFDFECDSEAWRQASKAERAQTTVNIVNTLWALLIDPVSKIPLVNPAQIIQKSLEQLDFVWVTVMTTDEQIEYLKNAQRVMAAWQAPQEPQAPAPQEAQPSPEQLQQAMMPQLSEDNAQLPNETDYQYFQRTGVTKPLV